MNRKITVLGLSLLSLFTTVSGQKENLQKIQQQFTAFSNNNPLEKLYVHTDKEFYLVGEIVWFKLYKDKEKQVSNVAYIDIIDINNKSILNAKISLKDFEDNGSVLIPLSVNSGNYRLRAYTNWMKNGANETFFEKIISIINPFKNPAAENLVKQEGYEINFFPEGGNLVKGLESKVAFKVTDKYGKGVECTGQIFDEQNEQVATFSSFKFGMGHFNFIPQNKTYKAVLQINGNKINTAYPSIQEQGYVMTVINNGNNIEVLVKSSYTDPQNINITCRNNDLIKYSNSTIMANGRASFTIAKTDLGKGVNQITILNTINKPVSERLLFIQPDSMSLVSAALNKTGFGNRQKVEVNVNANNANNKPVAANMSAAVYKIDSFQTAAPNDIVSYFWLASDLKGYIESPSYYFSAKNDQVENAADNLMLTQGWRRYNWNEILASQQKKNSNLIEQDAHTITAILKDKNSGHPVTNKEIFFSIPGSSFTFLTAITDNEGVATFNVKEMYGSKKIILQVNAPETNLYSIELLSPFFGETSATTAGIFHIEISQPLLEQYSINMQVQNIYSADSMRIFYSREMTDSLPFYGIPKYSYNLDAYKRFTTMEEVLREYVRELNVAARNGKLYLKIADEPRREFNEDNILVLWDGVPLKDPHSIYQFDPLKVKRLDIVPQKFAAGEMIFNGIASFTTYNNDMTGYNPSNAITIDYEGLQLQREFYSPSYHTEALVNSRMPDFRNTLYWSPNLVVDKAGNSKFSFYTADRKGNYLVVIQGVDENGNPVSTTTTFQVK